ncbi:hypothetical protein BDZ45DRAFT_755446 [Acephala macrosclerotiorum]|nr:hypothetical protein BDZ45DRAFT_755446 [Acephala macrosclerotiorum]
MRYIALCSITIALASVALAQGPQPCYNQADPDGGLPSYCYCSDGSCWAISSNDCMPTSNEQLDPCPVGDPESG